jgi:hypothetical protein
MHFFPIENIKKNVFSNRRKMSAFLKTLNLKVELQF